MAHPCQCLLPDTDSTKVSIRKNVVETKGEFINIRKGVNKIKGGAMLVTLKRQTLPNGVKVRAGFELWIPHTNAYDVNGLQQLDVPNWKLNELIRTINLDKIRNGES